MIICIKEELFIWNFKLKQCDTEVVIKNYSGTMTIKMLRQQLNIVNKNLEVLQGMQVNEEQGMEEKENTHKDDKENNATEAVSDELYIQNTLQFIYEFNNGYCLTIVRNDLLLTKK